MTDDYQLMDDAMSTSTITIPPPGGESESDISLSESNTASGMPCLLVKGYAVTPGTHGKYTWTPEVIKSMVPMMNNKPVLIDHQVDDTLSKGRVVNVEYSEKGILATTMITDPPTIAKIQSGEIGAYSVKARVAYDINGKIRRIVDFKELTLAHLPVDGSALFHKTKPIIVDVAMAKTNDQPPIPEVTISHKGGNTLSDNKTEQKQESEPDASGAEQVTEVKMSQEQVDRFTKLEQQNEELLKVVEVMNAKAKAEEVVREVKTWVENGNLLSAAEEKTRSLLMNVSDDDAKLFSEIIALNQVDPMGLKGEGSGMVRSEEKTEEKPVDGVPQIDWDGMAPEVFETVLNSFTQEQLMANGNEGAQMKKFIEQNTRGKQ